MDKMTFSIYAHKQLGAKCVNNEWRFRRGERFFALQIETDVQRHSEVGLLAAIALVERVMPEDESNLRAKVKVVPLAKTDATGMSKDDITRWVYKCMLRAVLG